MNIVLTLTPEEAAYLRELLMVEGDMDAESQHLPDADHDLGLSVRHKLSGEA